MSGRVVDLPDGLSALVDAQVRSGRHLDASGVVREALRRHEDAPAAETARVDALRHAVRQGREAIGRGRYFGSHPGQDPVDIALGRFVPER